MSTSAIITEQHLPMLQKSLSDLDAAEKELELARRAGLFETAQGAALKDLVKQVSDARQLLLGIKQTYFPGQ